MLTVMAKDISETMNYLYQLMQKKQSSDYYAKLSISVTCDLDQFAFV